MVPHTRLSSQQCGWGSLTQVVPGTQPHRFPHAVAFGQQPVSVQISSGPQHLPLQTIDGQVHPDPIVQISPGWQHLPLHVVTLAGQQVLVPKPAH